MISNTNPHSVSLKLPSHARPSAPSSLSLNTRSHIQLLYTVTFYIQLLYHSFVTSVGIQRSSL